jgi:hypothetical protein
MRRALLTICCTLLLAGCTNQAPAFRVTTPPDAGINTPPTDAQLAAHRDDHPGVLTITPNGNHVTGLPYPSLCVRPTGADPSLPVRACTPGSVRSDITQDNIDQTICNPAWSTQTIRPPKDETDALKTAAMHAYGVPPSQRAKTELDHDVPLWLGGSDDVTNFWPQVSDIPNANPPYRNTKDDIEGWLHDGVCQRKVTLAAAQWAIAINWHTAMATLGLPIPQRKTTR